MKKNKLKSLLKFGILLFGISLTLINCSDDETFKDDNSLNNSNFIIKIIPEQEYNKNSKLSKQLGKFRKSKSHAQNKDIYNSEYDFTVNTDFAKYVESVDGTNHSYTFPIIGSFDDNVSENLVISLQPDGTYNTEIIEYKFIDETNLEIRKANLNINATDYLSKSDFSYSCATTVNYNYVLNTSVADCPEGPCLKLVITSVNTSCSFNYEFVDVPSGGGGWNGTVISSGGIGGVSTTDGTVINTTTTSPFDFGAKRTRKYLKQLVENPIISAKIGELAPKVDSDQSGNLIEDGARFKFISENNYTVRLPSVKKGSSVSYIPDYKQNETVSVHIHQTKAYKYKQDGTSSDQPLPNSPIYSSQDIIEFLENLNYIETTNSDLTEDVASLLISKKPNTPINVNQANIFALVVDSNGDKNDALDAHTALQDDDTYDDFIEYFKDNVLRGWELGDCDDTCVIQSFIDFINTYEINGEPLGISIYQYTNFNGTINWIKR